MERVKRIEKRAVIIIMVATFLSMILIRSFNFTLGLAVGGVIELLNFYALRRIIQEILKGTSPQKQALMAFALMLKFVALAVSLYFATRMLPVDMLAVIIGVSLMLVSIVIEGFYPEKLSF